MAVVGLCHLCSRPALATCHVCGRPTCLLHLDDAHAVCASCREGKRSGPVRRA